MSRPPMVPLSAVCGRITDGTHQPPKFSGDGVPFIFVSNIGNGRIDLKTSKFITPSQHQELTQRCPVEPGDVLYTTVGSYGNAAQVLGSVPFAFQRHIAHLKPMRDLVAPAYLAAVLNSAIVRRQVDRLVRGVAQKTLNLAALKSVLVPLPSLREQQRIAEILDRADALRAKRRDALALLDTLPQSIFVEMFGDRETILAKWPTARLATLLTFLTSGSRAWAEYYCDAGNLFLRIQNVRRDELVLDDATYVTAPNTAEAKRTRVEPGDVLLSITADLGRTAVVPEGLGAAFINQHLCILRTQALVPRFLSAYLTSPAGQREVMGRNRHAVKAGLNFDDIRSIATPLPPMSEQREFARRVAAVDKLKAAHLASLAQLDSLFASLQHRAFRGEL